MEKYCQHVADHATVAVLGCALGGTASLLLVLDLALASALGYGLSGVLLFTAMMLLMARTVNSLTRKYGAAEGVAGLSWRLDAAVCALVSAFFLAHFSAVAAIYHALGGTSRFEIGFVSGTIILILYMLLVGLCARWFYPWTLRYLLWVRFGANWPAPIELPRRSSSLRPNLFRFQAKESGRQIDTLAFMLFSGILFGAQSAFMFAVTAVGRLDFAKRHIIEFDRLDYLQTRFLISLSAFICCYLVVYLGTIAANAWYAKFGNEQERRLRLHWKQDLMAFMFALLLFPAQVVLMLALCVAFNFMLGYYLAGMLGYFLLCSYLVLLLLLSGKKWFVLGLSSCFLRLGFDKKGTA